MNDMIKYKKTVRGNFGHPSIDVRPVQGKTVSSKEIALEIERTVGIPAIRTMSVLSAFVEMAYNHLEDGEPVLLDGLGTLKPGLSLEGETVVAKKINLIASTTMKERLGGFRLIEETTD